MGYIKGKTGLQTSPNPLLGWIMRALNHGSTAKCHTIFASQVSYEFAWKWYTFEELVFVFSVESSTSTPFLLLPPAAANTVPGGEVGDRLGRGWGGGEKEASGQQLLFKISCCSRCPMFNRGLTIYMAFWVGASPFPKIL